jgi:energy-coupling factor transporter ATP-binding protein EcfA2
MKLRRISIDGYKNLRQCELVFDQQPLLNAVIGSNGSGKSNLIEAILHILIDVYLRRLPPFDFEFEFESQGRDVRLTGKASRLTVEVDGVAMPASRFTRSLREGPAQVYYPELTFVYYSGECRRVRSLIKRYQRHFERLTRTSEADKYRPLFVESTNEQSQIILLSLCAHREREFLKRLGSIEAVDVSVVLRSPSGFDPKIHEPKLWNTEGAVRRIIAAIDDTANVQETGPQTDSDSEEANDSNAYSEIRTYKFSNDIPGKTILDLASRLVRSEDNLYVAFQHLATRGILLLVDYQLRASDRYFSFNQLSEGEKQLIAVVGALTLSNQADNLILLDEPDTHLNPQWTWEYPSMLRDAFEDDQLSRSTVLMATHDPVMISGMTREQVWLAQTESVEMPMFTHPVRNPRGQGIANLICSSEFFGLPSSLDKETQKLLDERLDISLKEDLTEAEKARLRELNEELEIIVQPGISERDPDYVEFLRQKYRRLEA